MPVYEVSLSDGRTIDVNAPNPASAKKKALQDQAGGREVAAGSLVRSNAGQVLGNIPGQPAAPPEQIGSGTAFLGAAGEKLVDAGGNLANLLSRQFIAAPKNQSILNLPSGRDVLSGVDMADNFLRTGKAGTMDEARLRREKMAADFPKATTAGDIFADAAMLFRGSQGAKAGLKGVDGGRANRMAGRLHEFAKHGPKSFKREMAIWLDSPKAKAIGKTLGRSFETGVEGAAMGALNDGDPAEMFGWSAGGQVAGTMGVNFISSIFRGGPWDVATRVGVAALGATALIQTLKTSTPGGTDYILPSIESGFAKTAAALGLSAIAGLAGAGRIKGHMWDNVPQLADALTGIPRGATLSLLEDITHESEQGNDAPESVLSMLSKDPGVFREEWLKPLERAMTTTDASFPKVVNRLMQRYPKFRELVEAPHPDLAGVPVKEEE